MGIAGLFHFVQTHPTLGRFVNWSSSNKSHDLFFFDGNAYVHQLRKDWLYGGNYEWMAETIKKKVNQLRLVGIEPVFLFDGSLPLDKLPTRKDRKKQSIESCAFIMNRLDLINRNKAERDSLPFLIPPWAMDVAVHVLKALKVRVELCEYEADEELVRLAEKEGGYVVSQDSDMYIYPSIGKGYIPLSGLRVGEFVDAQVFCPDRLAALLKLDLKELPLLGTLMGNDYMSKEAWKAIIEKEERSGGRKQWPLAVAEFIVRHRGDDLLGLVPQEKRTNMKCCLTESVERYRPNSLGCSLMPNNELSRLLVDVIKSQTLWTGIFLEDVTKKSCWSIGQKLRKAVYEIQRESLQMEEYSVIEYIRTKQHLEAVGIYSLKRTQTKDWDWFTELHSSRRICLQPVKKSDGLLFLILCLRYMIAESVYEESLADHEVIALVLSCLRCLSSSLGFEGVGIPKLESMPLLNRRSIHLLAQYQAVVYSSHILSQMLQIPIQAPLLRLYHGPYFHYCLEKTRSGDSPGSLLPDVSLEFVALFNEVYQLTTQDLEVRQVFEYDSNLLSKEKPKRVASRKRKQATKQSSLVRTNNVFDLLKQA